MLYRGSVIQAGLGALGAASVYAPSVLRAQNKPLVKIRYNEVVRSVLYAPAYVAITNGYFKDAGLDEPHAVRRASTGTRRATTSSVVNTSPKNDRILLSVVACSSSVKVALPSDTMTTR